MRTVGWRSAILGCVAVFVAGCGSSGGGKASSAAVSPAQAQNAKGSITWCIGKDTTGTFQQGVTEFNKTSAVKATLTELPAEADGQRQQQIQRLQAKSSACDVLGTDVVWTGEYASQGWIRDMTDVVSARKSEFLSAPLKTASYKGKYWAVPFNSNAGLLYYRTDQVSQAPTTWQQVYSLAKSKHGLVYQGMAYEGLTVDFLEMLYSAGGQVLSPDGKQAVVNSPQAQQVLNLMVQGLKDGSVPKGVTTYNEDADQRVWGAGQATFMRNWPSEYAASQQTSVKGKFNVAPLPKFGSGPASGVIGGYNLAISSYSKNPGGALAFIKFLTSPPWQKTIATKATLPPVLSATYADPAVAQAFPFAPKLKAAIEQSLPRPVSPVYQQITDAISKNVHAALTGDTQPAAALKAMSDQINTALKTF